TLRYIIVVGLRQRRGRTDRRRRPDQFRHAPGLGDASPGSERFGSVEDLAHGPDAGLSEMVVEAAHHGAGFLAAVGEGLEPGVDERTEEPGPDRALVVGAVTGPQVAVVGGLVI